MCCTVFVVTVGAAGVVGAAAGAGGARVAVGAAAGVPTDWDATVVVGAGAAFAGCAVPIMVPPANMTRTAAMSAAATCCCPRKIGSRFRVGRPLMVAPSSMRNGMTNSTHAIQPALGSSLVSRIWLP